MNNFEEIKSFSEIKNLANPAKYFFDLLSEKKEQELESMPSYDSFSCTYSAETDGSLPRHYLDATVRWLVETEKPTTLTASEVAEKICEQLPTLGNNNMIFSYLSRANKIKDYVEQAILERGDELFECLMGKRKYVEITSREYSGMYAAYEEGKLYYAPSKKLRLYVRRDLYHAKDFLDDEKEYLNPFFFFVWKIEVVNSEEDLPYTNQIVFAKALTEKCARSDLHRKTTWGLHLLGTKLMNIWTKEYGEINLAIVQQLGDDCTTFIGTDILDTSRLFYCNTITNELTALSTERAKEYKDGVDLVEKRISFLSDDLNIKSLINKKVLDLNVLPAIEREIEEISSGEIPKLTGYSNPLSKFRLAR